MSHASPAEVIEDVACTICGCLCDDLRVHVSGDRIDRVENDCPLSRPWFEAVRAAAQRPAATIDGRESAFDDAVKRAAEILAPAKSPLIYGLSRSSTEGQRAACRLADFLGATIDTTASLCHAPSIMALQAVGESTSSLGEIRHRCDLVIYWGSDPMVSHPRHLERYGPGEYSADALLSRGEVDACLLVDSEGIEPLSPAAKGQLRRIPTIVLDYPHVRSPIDPTVHFTTAIYGIHREGTAYRMDEAPIPLRRVMDSPFPSDGEVLRNILARVKLLHLNE